MAKIGVVGKRNAVLYYMSVGYSVYESETPETAGKAIKKAADDGCAVIFVTEDVAQAAAEEIDSYRNLMLPAICVIPSKDSGTDGFGIRLMKDAVERAVGADIIFRDNG